MANGRRRGIIIGSNKFYFAEPETQDVDSFLNEVGIFVAGVAKLDGGNTDKENASTGVTVAGRLEPRVVGVPVDLFFQRIENARPWVGSEGRCACC